MLYIIIICKTRGLFTNLQQKARLKTYRGQERPPVYGTNLRIVPLPLQPPFSASLCTRSGPGYYVVLVGFEVYVRSPQGNHRYWIIIDTSSNFSSSTLLLDIFALPLIHVLWKVDVLVYSFSRGVPYLWNEGPWSVE